MGQSIDPRLVRASFPMAQAKGLLGPEEFCGQSPAWAIYFV